VVAPLPVTIKGVTIDVVAPLLVAIEGVDWARDGPKFVWKVDGCNALYTPNTIWCNICGHATM